MREPPTATVPSSPAATPSAGTAGGGVSTTEADCTALAVTATLVVPVGVTTVRVAVTSPAFGEEKENGTPRVPLRAITVPSAGSAAESPSSPDSARLVSGRSVAPSLLSTTVPVSGDGVHGPRAERRRARPHRAPR